MAPKRPVRVVQSEVWLDRTEFEDLIRQREPETAEAPRYLATATKVLCGHQGPERLEIRRMRGGPRCEGLLTVARCAEPAKHEESPQQP